MAHLVRKVDEDVLKQSGMQGLWNNVVDFLQESDIHPEARSQGLGEGLKIQIRGGGMLLNKTDRLIQDLRF